MRNVFDSRDRFNRTASGSGAMAPTLPKRLNRESMTSARVQELADVPGRTAERAARLTSRILALRFDVTAVLVVWLVALTVLPIIASPYRGDDTVNQNIRQIIADKGQTFWQFDLASIAEWMHQVGRFYPASLTWTYGIFYVLQQRVAYKIALCVVLVIAIVLIGLVARHVTGDRRAPVVLATFVVPFLQVRNFYDGLVSYAGLLSLSTALAFAALLIALTRSGVAWGVLATASYWLGISVYENVLLFAPAFVMVAALQRRTWRACVPLVLAPAIELAVVVAIRPGAASTAGASYTLNLAPGTWLPTVAKQATAALPLSQWWLGSGTPAIPVPTLALSLLLVAVPAWLVVRAATARAASPQPAPRDSSFRAYGLVVMLGLWMWLSTSSLVGATVRWQQEVPWGQGYLAVVYGYFGLALSLSALILYLSRSSLLQNRSGLRRVCRVLFPLAFAVVTVLTFAGNVALTS